MKENIKAYRKKAGISQAELAARIGYKQSAIGMWEVGARKPPSDKLPELAKALNCTIDELFAPPSGTAT